jgi:DNA-binding SARP family transcriptional activator
MSGRVPIRGLTAVTMVSGGAVRLQILGPLRVWRGDVELEPGQPQQAYLLALLVARAGRPVSQVELIDLIWGEDVPASAANTIQKYVGALRRLLEPALAAREAGSYLRRRVGGYEFVAGPGVLDLVIFRRFVGAARAALAQGNRELGLDHYVEALGLWHGPAADGQVHTTAGMSIFAGLNEEFLEACTAAGKLAVSVGRPQSALSALRLAASMAPLHEPVQAALVAALGAAGQRAEALSWFRTVRSRLVEDLGIDPGPALQAAHRQVLTLPPSEPEPAGTRSPSGGTQAAPDSGLVGRAVELAVLRQMLNSVFAGGTGILVVEGEPGAGKTRLLEEMAADAMRREALVVWGSCLEGDGTPSMWPWVEAVRAVLDGLPVAVRETWLDGALGRLVEPHDDFTAGPVPPDSDARFWLFEQVVGVLSHLSGERPVIVIIDDLQWADVASLQLFGHLAARLPRSAMIAGAIRERAPVPGPEVSRTLAAVNRMPGHRRIRLGPLTMAEVAELVRRQTGRLLGFGAARSIHARTAGNPFFAQELARFLAVGGAVTDEAAIRAEVPSTVRDVVRGRMADLDDVTTGLLQIAALIGRDVDLSVLARAAGIDIQACLDRLEPLEALGLLGPAAGDPFSFRFAHDLIRESIASVTPPQQATRLHFRVAEAIDVTGTADEPAAERLAYHLWASGPLADPARTAGALVRAGRRAATKSAFEAAERQLRSAIQVARAAGLAELELSAVSLLTTVFTRQFDRAFPYEMLERAEDLARELGREREAADFLFSRFVWAISSVLTERGPLARLLLGQGEASPDPVVLAYGRQAWGIYQWDIGNIGEAIRYMGDNWTFLGEPSRRVENPLRQDMRQLWALTQAMAATMHGDLSDARGLFDRMEADAGNDRYLISLWAHFSTMTAAMAGDPAWSRRASERWIATDPHHFFSNVDVFLRMTWCWTRALSGDDPIAAAAEAEAIADAELLDPPRSNPAFLYGLVADMLLAGGLPTRAAVILDRADLMLDAYGQRYAEGLLLLLRARVLHARGEPAAVVRAAAEKARALSAERGAHLFARRAEEFLSTLAEDGGR